MRHAITIFGIFLLGLAGFGLFAVAVLMPVGLGGIDPAVLAEAGRNTPRLEQARERWTEAGKPGTAALFDSAHARIEIAGEDFPILPVRTPIDDPVLRLWGGADPFLEQVFVRYEPQSSKDYPPVAPLFIPRQARQELSAFLEASRSPAVRAVLNNREVEYAAQFMPVASSAGQPLEATLYLTALLLQGNHFSQDLSSEIRRLAENAVRENKLGDAEGVYLDILALGSRLQWQPLADLLPLLNDRQALRRTAHLSRALEDDWPVFAAAALWTRDTAELSQFLIDYGHEGLADLKQAMLHGEGAIRLLLAQQGPVRPATWRSHLPGLPVLLAELHAQSPALASLAKLGALLVGLVIFFFALNLFFQVEGAGKTLGRPVSFSLLQALLLATACSMTFLFLTEPLAAQEGQNSDFQITLPISLASADLQTTIEKGLSLDMDQLTLIALAIFFSLQLILYIICWIKVMEIRRQPIASHLKLKLLENEDHLFDSGLYIGLAGTVGALIFLALGVVGPSLMAAYASTLFGIVFVAFFKICHLRPYRRRLIVESQTYS